jgi:hypothetical protein
VALKEKALSAGANSVKTVNTAKKTVQKHEKAISCGRTAEVTMLVSGRAVTRVANYEDCSLNTTFCRSDDSRRIQRGDPVSAG